ncbi:type VI secretion system protein TssL [Caulobacter flavus]|jgi:type VI secretion system protein ImpK|uniref:Type VI secretion system protein TssL n=1 Tax=Caulobacter flavus TaxID=1679497 RepID=A0A2N5CZF8_9CAUL|nr:type IVB secretion system protein IcmH/DotU [Caulobacter flavus]AYV45127.1 type VI secretion system protein TssL [Caulobacter flavus]PLR19193.1 type VI secretion system protein TssL [Caulobacter flavus]
MSRGDEESRRPRRSSPLKRARETQIGIPLQPGASPEAWTPKPQPSLPDDDVPSPPIAPESRNPMMALAGPILARIAALRVGRLRTPLRQLHREMTAEIAEFRVAIYELYPEKVAECAVYAVCATVDDVAMNLPDQDDAAEQYATRNMVLQVFGHNVGGDHFTHQIDLALQGQDAYQDLLELFHACLAAGFRGRIGVNRGAEAYMQALFKALDHPRKLSSTELTPHWRGVDAPARTTGVWGGVGVVAAIAVGFLLTVYMILNLVLAWNSSDASNALAQIFPEDKVSLADPAGTPVDAAPESPVARAIRACLGAEQEAGLLEVEENPGAVWVRTPAHSQLELFKPGSDRLEASVPPLLERISGCMEPHPGPVDVIGYTDSVGIHTLTFPNNQRLSEARAERAADIIRRRLGSRVTSEGRGENDPFAGNSTAEGRRLNRRLEIVLRRVG